MRPQSLTKILRWNSCLQAISFSSSCVSCRFNTNPISIQPADNATTQRDSPSPFPFIRPAAGRPGTWTGNWALLGGGAQAAARFSVWNPVGQRVTRKSGGYIRTAVLLQLHTHTHKHTLRGLRRPPQPRTSSQFQPYRNPPSWLMMRIDKGELWGSVRTYMLCIHSRTTLKDKSLGFLLLLFFYFTTIPHWPYQYGHMESCAPLFCPLRTERLLLKTTRRTRPSQYGPSVGSLTVSSMCRWPATTTRTQARTQEESQHLLGRGGVLIFWFFFFSFWNPSVQSCVLWAATFFYLSTFWWWTFDGVICCLLSAEM